ncbi:hypothetical protein J3F84DRAFT_372412 [Trichoderma pleuroticola]
MIPRSHGSRNTTTTGTREPGENPMRTAHCGSRTGWPFWQATGRSANGPFLPGSRFPGPLPGRNCGSHGNELLR